jgi:hypothetical protein
MVQKNMTSLFRKILYIFFVILFCWAFFYVWFFVYDILDRNDSFNDSVQKEFVTLPDIPLPKKQSKEEAFSVMAEALKKEDNIYNAFIGPITLKFNQEARTIDWKFTIENYSEDAIAGATYSLYITSNKKENFPEFYFDKQTSTPLNIPAKGILDVDFSYKVHPSFSSTDAGIQIELSSKWGWFINRGYSDNTTSINSLTQSHLIVPVNALLKTELWTEYSISSGPAIYEELKPKNLFLHFSVQNLSDKKVSFIPEIDIYSFSDEWTPIKTLQMGDDVYTVDPKTISPEIVIPVPNMDFKPDVYFWRITLKNKETEYLIYHPDFLIRWMVGWEVAKIQDIISQDEYFKKWKPMSMLLKYTGTPADIYFDPEIQDSAAYVSWSVSNREALFRAVILDKTWKEISPIVEKRVPIYNSSTGDIWQDNTKELAFEVTPLSRSSELSLKVSLQSAVDGKILDEKISPIITPLGYQSKHKYEWYLWLLVLFVGIVILLWIHRWRKNK